MCTNSCIYTYIQHRNIFKNSCTSQDNQKLIVSGKSLGKCMHGFIDKLTGFVTYVLSVMLV